MARGGDAIEVTVLEGRVHAALTRVDTQDTIYDLIVRWAPEVAVGAAD